MKRGLVVFSLFLGLWSLVWVLAGRMQFLVPPPWDVAATLIAQAPLLLHHALITFAEILLGMLFGCIFGGILAISMAFYRPAALWLWPVFVATQALPVFAIAPLLVLWFGYGVASKVVMATLIIFFPVASNFYDGLRRTDPDYLNLAHTMGASRWAIIRFIRIPAALPALASGLRVAAAVAPIGAVVGEWVGSSSGLGFLMLHANARVQIPLMFAALSILAVMAVLLHSGIGYLVRRALPWAPDSLTS